ncbi:MULTISPECIES: LysR substrate-binding domain-containing protein [unclassified Rhizobium]|nr:MULTISPECIES: LysR substrate-binding domain-containing protein [unclassified Rhizobium]
MVASPVYLKTRGRPDRPEELTSHGCLRQRSPATGKLSEWPLMVANSGHFTVPETMSATTIEPLIYLMEKGIGIAFLPPFAVDRQIADGALVSLLDDYSRDRRVRRALANQKSAFTTHQPS